MIYDVYRRFKGQQVSTAFKRRLYGTVTAPSDTDALALAAQIHKFPRAEVVLRSADGRLVLGRIWRTKRRPMTLNGEGHPITARPVSP